MFYFAQLEHDSRLETLMPLTFRYLPVECFLLYWFHHAGVLSRVSEISVTPHRATTGTRSYHNFVNASSKDRSRELVLTLGFYLCFSDQEFDRLKASLREAGSVVAVSTEPKCYIDTGICTVTFQV